MATLNKVMLIGRLTDNPEEPRTLPNSGNRVIKFRFAVGRGRKNESGGWDPDPNLLYIDCEAFSRPDAKRDLVSLIAQYAKKGDSLYVEGRLQLDQWTDKTSGQQRSKHKVVVDGIEFVGVRNNEEGGGAGAGGGGYSRNEGGGGGGGFNRGNDRPASNGGYGGGGSTGVGRPGGNAGGGRPAGGGKPGGYSPPPQHDDDGPSDAGDGGEIPF